MCRFQSALANCAGNTEGGVQVRGRAADARQAAAGRFLQMLREKTEMHRSICVYMDAIGSLTMLWFDLLLLVTLLWHVLVASCRCHDN